MHSELNCLQKLPLFSKLSKSTLAKLNTISHHREFYPKGSLIVTPTSSHRLVEIDQGQAKVYSLSKEGNEKILYLLNQGNVEGQSNLFASVGLDKYVEATRDSWVCSIDYQDFQDFLITTPQVAVELLNSLGSRILELEVNNSRRDLLDAKERIYAYLVDWQAQANSQSFTLPIKKAEFANILGISPATLSRNLKVLIQDGRITMQGKIITILKKG